MQNKIKSKFKSNVMSVLLTLCVSVMCVIGMSMVQHAAATVPAHQSWGKLSAELPSGTVNYYKVSALDSSTNAPVDKYLKVVKNIDSSASLTVSFEVYEADSSTDVKSINEYGFLPVPVANAVQDTEYKLTENGTGASAWFHGTKWYSDSTHQIEMDPQPTGNVYLNTLSSDFTATWNYTSNVESWTIGLAPGTTYNTPLLSVSPICTTIKATKTWNGMESGSYVSVADQTVVKFKFNDDSSTKNFWVKKVIPSSGTPYLQISPSGAENSWSDNRYVDDTGKTINARLVDADNATIPKTPEKWEITITGYDRESGALIEYKVDEVDVSSAGTQHWTAGATTLTHTYGGNVDPDSSTLRKFTYTLQLHGTPAGASAAGDTDLLSIEKTMALNTTTGAYSVASIVVKGLTNDASIPANLVTYTTIVNAVLGTDHPNAANNSITFNNTGSDISISEIQTADDGVTVHFNIGENNGAATLVLKLTTAGRLSYAFAGLPATEYMPDPDNTAAKIAVDYYKVGVGAGNAS